MTALYIIGGIILFFAFILSLKANVKLEFADELVLSVKVLFINIKITPKEKKPLDYKSYSYEQHKKRLRKKYAAYLKKEEKKKQKAEAKAKKKEALANETPEQKEARKNAPKRAITDWIDLAGAVLGKFFGKFAKHFRIKVARLKVNVATGDAASTAIMYGVVIQSVAYIIELLKKVTNVDGLNKAEIAVVPDYLSDKMTLDLCFVFSLRVWHLFDMLFSTAFKAIAKFIETDPKKSAGGQKKRKKKKKSAAKKGTESSPLPAKA